MNSQPPSATDLSAQAQFAEDVVRRLRTAGFEALWAGGCVRDRLMGRVPKDYDVATSARPDQIQEVFRRQRTLAIGAAFGVIAVVGKRRQGTVEVATFRRDATYSDGRHPDSVTFSTAEHDAQRRDFTINGLFFDPLQQRVIDYVGGQQDLDRKLIRAIRDPLERIAEDKLRMLRAVRFAAVLDFELDPATLAAVQGQAAHLDVVSAERIAEELRRMLGHSNRQRAVELLNRSRLFDVIFGELVADRTERAAARNAHQAQLLAALGEAGFPMGLAGLLWPGDRELAEAVGRRLRLSNEEISLSGQALDWSGTLRSASKVPWPRLQRILIEPTIHQALDFAAAVAQVVDGDHREIDFCRRKLELPPAELNPPVLLNGNDLKQAGFRPGPHFKQLLNAIRDAQLDGRVRSFEEALACARRLAPPDSSAENPTRG